MNRPECNKKLKKMFNFWMEPRMGPPYNEPPLCINSQGCLSVNSGQKSHSPLGGCLTTAYISELSWVHVRSLNDSHNVYFWALSKANKTLYSFNDTFPDYGAKHQPLDSKKS